ncbi:VanZ family protein [Klugiella xanthotipulae]|nr:VanZ family protein [Klugiella xanthotipulae]
MSRVTTHPTTQNTVTAPARERNRAVLAVLCAIYLGTIVWIVLWKLETPWAGDETRRIIKLVPFVPSGGAGASAPLEVLANLLLFIPFGVYLGLLARSWSVWRIASVVAGWSLALEVAEYVLAVGSSDITDVIVNTAGGLVGLGLLALVRFELQGQTTAVMTRVCAIGTVLVLTAAGLFIIASPPHYGPPMNGDPGLSTLRSRGACGDAIGVIRLGSGAFESGIDVVLTLPSFTFAQRLVLFLGYGVGGTQVLRALRRLYLDPHLDKKYPLSRPGTSRRATSHRARAEQPQTSQQQDELAS